MVAPILLSAHMLLACCSMLLVLLLRAGGQAQAGVLHARGAGADSGRQLELCCAWWRVTETAGGQNGVCTGSGQPMLVMQRGRHTYESSMPPLYDEYGRSSTERSRLAVHAAQPVVGLVELAGPPPRL